MVEVVKSSAGIARYEVQWVEKWYVVATVNINCFHQPDQDPCPHQYEMSCGQHDTEKEAKTEYCKYNQRCCVYAYQQSCYTCNKCGKNFCFIEMCKSHHS